MMIDAARRWLGGRLAAYLTQPSGRGPAAAPTEAAALAAVLQPCDVLLVEGTRRISSAIKYLTQSTWSHAALCVASPAGFGAAGAGEARFVEADLKQGVRLVAIDEYAGQHVRICRPVGLTDEDGQRVIDYCLARVGNRYDLKHVADLARYLLPRPPVPIRWRRQWLELGSGDPTRAICSTLIAQAFQSVRYPILPTITRSMSADPGCAACVREIHRLRHHSLFAPRDFDVSPYFAVIKPRLAGGFDYRSIEWSDEPPA